MKQVQEEGWWCCCRAWSQTNNICNCMLRRWLQPNHNDHILLVDNFAHSEMVPLHCDTCLLCVDSLNELRRNGNPCQGTVSHPEPVYAIRSDWTLILSYLLPDGVGWRMEQRTWCNCKRKKGSDSKIIVAIWIANFESHFLRVCLFCIVAPEFPRA